MQELTFDGNYEAAFEKWVLSSLGVRSAPLPASDFMAKFVNRAAIFLSLSVATCYCIESEREREKKALCVVRVTLLFLQQGRS